MPSLFPDDRPVRPRPALQKFRSARPKAEAADPPPLPADWILAHCDGGARGNPGPAGFGAVLVDSAGVPLAELSEFLGFRTNNFAEYSGLLAVLDWALRNGHSRMRVVSDSELMVKQIQGKYKVNSPDLRPLYEEAKRRITQLEGFEIQHALRHKNKVADRLANEAMDRGMGKARTGAEPGAQPPRATPYPAAGSSKPPRPASFGGLQEERARRPAAAPSQAPSQAPGQAPSQAPSQVMLRGFVRDGVVHPLGGAKLPEGAFVKILPE